jgi:UDP-N-acetylglucosamine 2-epimerase (non-hydrolysing)
VTIEEGTNTLVGNDPNRIRAAARDILRGQAKKGRTPALWDGKAAERVVSILLA